MQTQTDSMIYRRGIIAGLVILLMMAGFSWWAATRLPAGGHYPIHWNYKGQADGYGSRGQLLVMLPVVAAVVMALLAGLPFLDPRREHIRRSMKAYMMITVSGLAVLLTIHVMMISVALGAKVNVLSVIGVMTGLLFCVIGNYLGKLRSNFFAGVRTPWTLSSELSWNKTNRLAGKLSVLLGLALIIAGFVGKPFGMIAVFVVMMPIFVIVPITYSYIVWKHDPARLPAAAKTTSR